MNETDFQMNGSVIVKYTGPGGEVVVPEGVTDIGSSAFARNTTVTAVTLPESLTHLDYGVFANCTALEKVYIADGPTDVHNSIFENCAALKEVRLPNTLKGTGRYLFRGCTALESVTLPDSLEHIHDGAFQGCTALKEIVIPQNVTTIWKGAFAGCTALEKVTIGRKVSSFWGGAFAMCTSLKEVTVDPENEKFTALGPVLLSKDGKTLEMAMPGIKGEYTVPDGVETVKSSAFYACNNLTAIRFAPSVNSISFSAFANCDELVSIIIPATVKQVDFDAFSKQQTWNGPQPKAYTELIVSPEAGSVSAGGIWLGPGDGPVCYPQLPFHFATSKEDKQRLALGYCLNPEKYTEEYAPAYLKYVKSQRKGLITLAQKKRIKGIQEFYDALDAKPGAKTKKKAEAPAPVPAAPTENASPAEDFEIVDGKLIHYLGKAETVVVPDTVEYVCAKAFYNCKNLEKVVFPQSATCFEKKAFVKCPALETVILYAVEPTLDFDFYKLRTDLNMIAPNASPAVFPAEFRQDSVRSLAIAVSEGVAAMPDHGGKVAGYLKRANRTFFPLAAEEEAVLDLMIHLGAIGAKEAPDMLDQCKNLSNSAKLKLTALTGGEKKKKAPADKLEAGLKRKGPTVAELKQDWTYATMVFDKSFTKTDSIKGIVLRRYKGLKTEVEVPAYIGKNPVIGIGAGTFEHNTTITSVTIPETVLSVEDRAFDGCDALISVNHLGDKLWLGSFVFRDCKALSSFSTAAAEWRQGIHPFYGCDKLFDADGFLIQEIGEEKILVECRMPITKSEIVIPEGVTRIGQYAFGKPNSISGPINRNLRKVVLSESVKHIGGSAFTGADGLQTVILPEGLESIEGMAFCGCTAMTDIYIPASVKTLPAGVFYRCDPTIHGEPGSEAENHAKTCKLLFVPGK